jgi:cytoskeletal protein CcmA (bactofilin family)
MPKGPASPSLLSTDLMISGNINSTGEIQIDGTFEGDIKAETLLIGETALVKGEIIADTVRVHGRIEGLVRARVVSLAKSAHVVGDVLHSELAIEQGAYLEGHCRRIEDAGGKKSSESSGINLLVKGGSKGKAEPVKTDAVPQEAASG